ncbi:MAG TPA: hypothetical protein VMM93_10625 [Vicinamibacterales bacterium]|nr:hypothetical protein [Vicinamibacterales bacterium]
MVSALFLAIPLAMLAQAPATSFTSEPPPLAIYLRSYRADGRSAATVGDHGTDAFHSYVHADAALCRMGASNAAPWFAPDFGWYFSGRVVRRAGDDLQVQITWERRWSGGRELQSGPGGTMHLTMRPGDRLVLDSLVPATVGACGNVELRLEASVAGSVETLFVRPHRFEPVRPGTAPQVGIVDAVRRLAELWLVHTRSDGSESTQAQTTAIGGEGRPFEFPPVRIAGDAGPMAVSIGGRLSVSTTSGRERLSVLLERDLSGADGSRIASGGTAKTIDAPRAGHVVSFELPPPRSSGAATGGDRFAVRLRLSALPTRVR